LKLARCLCHFFAFSSISTSRRMASERETPRWSAHSSIALIVSGSKRAGMVTFPLLAKITMRSRTSRSAPLSPEGSLMPVNRREFLEIASSTVAASSIVTSSSSAETPRPSIKAIAFDGFPIFDPRPIFVLAEELFPGHGPELSNTWRIRQFEYTWLRTLTQRYRDFLNVIEDALVFAGKSLNLDITDEKKKALVEGYLRMKAWSCRRLPSSVVRPPKLFPPEYSQTFVRLRPKRPSSTLLRCRPRPFL